MKWSSGIASAAALAAVLAASVLYAQVGGGGGAGMGARTGAMDPARIRTMLERAGLNEKEQAAAQKSMEAKSKARQALQDEMDKLRLVTENSSATEEQSSQAAASYEKAMAKYREVVQTEDRTLSRELSGKGRARCLAAGIIDNGLGYSGRTRTGAGGAGGAGGMRGGGGGRGGAGGAGGAGGGGGY